MRRWSLALLAVILLPAVGYGQTGQLVEYYHTDALGNVRVVTNQPGQIIARYDYLPFGELFNPPNPPSQKLLFTGKERDFETGMDYFGARYVASNVGRFTTIDPVYTWKENLADPQRWNRYAYVRNNPLRFTDPDGRCIYPGASCLQFLVGMAKAAGNIVPDLIDTTNRATELVIAPVTDFRFGNFPRFEPANEDQRRGMIAGNVAMVFAAGTKAVGAAMELSGLESGSGLHTTLHGAERVAGPAATRGGVLSASEVLQVQGQGRGLVQSDGAAVHVLQTGNGRFSVVVEGERGIVTTFKNLSQKSLDKLGKNYGWREPE